MYRLYKFLVCGFLIGTLFNPIEMRAQNFVIDSVSTPANPTSCTNTIITVYTYLGCINWTDVSQTDSVSGSTIGVKILKNDPGICFGAISYPSYSLNLGMIPAGTYTLTVTGNGVSNGIISSLSKTVVVADCCPGAAFTASFSVNDTIICLGDSVPCTNTSQGSGLKYRWKVDGTLIDSTSNFTAHFSTTGLHNIQLFSDSAHCSRSKIANIHVIPVPVLNLGPDKNFCAGLSAVIDAGVGWDSLLWSTSETTNVINVKDSGVYTLITRDTSHCSLHYDTIVVKLKPSPIIDLGNDTLLCEGSKVTLNASNPNAVYKWQDNSTAPVYLVSQPGKYWVWVGFTTNLCSNSDSVNINYELCTGIDDIMAIQDPVVYPNPFEDLLYIKFETLPKQCSFTLTDQSGKLMVDIQNFDVRQGLNVSDLKSGVYFIRIRFDGVERIQKIVKLKS